MTQEDLLCNTCRGGQCVAILEPAWLRGHCAPAKFEFGEAIQIIVTPGDTLKDQEGGASFCR
jgi:hypothetical protein